jgi:putative pyruvate formate lyase activating enzyme
MHRQVGDLVVSDNGVASRGLLVRHLVLPENLAGTAEVCRFVADEISTDTYINVMDQYHPAGRMPKLGPLARRTSRREYADALAAAREAGLWRFDDRNR